MPPHQRFRIYANEVAQAADRRIFDQGKGIKQPAIIYTSNDYGMAGLRRFLRELRNPASAWLRATLQSRRSGLRCPAFAGIRAANPDGLYVWSFAAEAGIIVRQAKELGARLQCLVAVAKDPRRCISKEAPWPSWVWALLLLGVLPYTEDSDALPVVALSRVAEQILSEWTAGSAARPLRYGEAAAAPAGFRRGLRRIQVRPTVKRS